MANDFLVTPTILNNIVNNINFQIDMLDLYDRWEDEKEYEKIDDYAKPITNMLKLLLKETASIKMTKRPFGFKFVCNYTFTTKDNSMLIHPATIRIKVNDSTVSWTAKAIQNQR